MLNHVVPMTRVHRLEGQVFGNLTAISRVRAAPRSERRSNRNAMWLVRCTCGQELTVRTDNLTLGRQKSCTIAGHYWSTVGATYLWKKYPSEYGTWQHLRARCFDEKDDKYRIYGARGITVCERWSEFENFLADMGPKPTPRHTIERKDVNGNYEPDNCRWATRAEQARNLRRTVYVEHNGERRLLIDVADGLGLNRQMVYGRLKNGWSLEDALTIPVRPKKKNRRRRKKKVVRATTNIVQCPPPPAKDQPP